MHRNSAKSVLVIITVYFAAMVLLLLQGCASKRPEGRFGPEGARSPEQMMFNKWDKNVDGQATCDEVRSYRNKAFDQMDVDGNRILSTEELEFSDVRDPGIRRAVIADFDTNGNGVVTGTEFSTTLPPMFVEKDGDNDCVLTASEAGIPLGRSAQGQKPQRGGKGGRGGRRRTGP